MIYSERTDDTGSLLLICARAERSAALDDQARQLFVRLGEDRVRFAARVNKAEALVGSALAARGVNLSDDWRQLLGANEQRVARRLNEVAKVVVDLESIGAAVALIEGGGTLLSSELPLSGYSASDFDLLVDEAHWARVPELLSDHGYGPADRRGRPTCRVEFRRAEDQLVEWLEVGYRPFDRMWVPLPYHDRSATWLRRRRRAARDARIPVLDPTDALALVAMHTSLHSFVRSPGLRLHMDVDHTATANAVDWPRFVEEVTAMGVPTRAFVSLSMAAGLLGTRVPAWVLERLFPGKPRWGAIRGLLRRERVLADERRKLTGFRAIALDALLDERGPSAWAGSVVFPPTPWLREHFGSGACREESALRLHATRYLLLATQWRREVG